MKSDPIRCPEQKLTVKIATGNQFAFEELHRLYFNRLCKFAFLFLKSKEMSEEAVSDVFFNVWMKRMQLKSVKNIRSYLYTAVRHQAIDYLRSQKSYPQDNINAYELEITSPEPSAHDTVERDDFRQLLQHAFDELPERCRMISRMYFNDQLEYKEIASILDISRKTAEAQIAIAVRKVKEMFEKYGWNR